MVTLQIASNLFLAHFDLHFILKLPVPLTSDNWVSVTQLYLVHNVHLEEPQSLGCPGPQYLRTVLQESKQLLGS